MAQVSGAPDTLGIQHTQGHVLCCLCGLAIQPNPSNMCVNCLRTQVDITANVQKSVTIFFCRGCGRYLQPPRHWVKADLESRELLTFCVKRIRGLSKLKLVDAGFIWTEPHSKRLKLKLSVQGEVFNGAILQQTFSVDFVVADQPCLDCNRHAASPNVWTACVQVRQHVHHKRTFMFLEQMILRHGADASCTNIKEIHEGLDFFFANRQHAVKLVDFLQAVVPIKFRTAKQLVSHNIHTSNYNYKYTFSVEIVPVCKDDLVCLPAKLAASLGNLGPLVLCSRVSAALTLVDPLTLRHAQVEAGTYWHSPFRSLILPKQLVEFVVLDIELLGPTTSRHSLAEAQVARKSDFGRNDRMYTTITHLGQILHPGDTALGYDFEHANAVDPDLDRWIERGGSPPEVILVKKSYQEKRARKHAKGETRTWKLNRLAMEAAAGAEKASAQRARQAADRDTADMEHFLQELEEDADMRSRVALFKDKQAAAGRAARPAPSVAATDDDDGDFPEVPLEELLDDLAGLQLDEAEEEAAIAAAAAAGELDGGDSGAEDMTE
mmetsp:Transcript_18620/g.56214  ORF Transcript_18620/g.56214 Transcript_18620/m.56214 type:complete len:550 (+) Transcript_18620:224-1873(+)